MSYRGRRCGAREQSTGRAEAEEQRGRGREREKDRGGRDPPAVAGDAGSKRGRRMRFHRPWKGTACGYCHPMGFRFRCFQPADTILLDIIARPNYIPRCLGKKKKKKVSPLRGRMKSSPPLSPVDCNYYYYNKDGINDVSIVNDYRDYLLFDIYI